MNPRKLTPGRVAKAIDVFFHDWPGSCHQICVKLLRAELLPDGATLKRGKYTGPLVYGKYRAEIMLWSETIGTRDHSWIELADGTVVDPTRYVFEGVKPYIYVGLGDNYIENGGKK